MAQHFIFASGFDFIIAFGFHVLANVFDGDGRIQLLRENLNLITAIACRNWRAIAFPTDGVKRTMELYLNALEPLVVQEVERQLQNLPPDLVAYINPAPAIAYALNHLPPLYATSQEGYNRQQQKAKTQLAKQIELCMGFFASLSPISR